MSLMVNLRIQYLTLQRNYLQAQLTNNVNWIYRNPIQNCILETQLQAVNTELDSLHKLNLKA